MAWKIIFVAFLAVGVLAEDKVTDEQRQQYRQVLQYQCEKAGAADKIDQVESAVKTFINCTKGLFDIDTIKKEIEEAKPNGALDEVFKKYCEKAPQLKDCLHAVVEGVTPCIDPSMRQYIPTYNNGTEQLLDFVCFKDGDRIALFIAEGGPECFQAQANQIRECGQKVKDSVSPVEAVKNFNIADQCAKFDELSACVVKALEGCKTLTPGNMAESLFRYMRNSSPCTKL